MKRETTIYFMLSIDMCPALRNYPLKKKIKMEHLDIALWENGENRLTAHGTLTIFALFAMMKLTQHTWRDNLLSIYKLMERFKLNPNDAVNMFLMAKGVKFNVENPYMEELCDIGESVYIIESQK